MIRISVGLAALAACCAMAAPAWAQDQEPVKLSDLVGAWDYVLDPNTSDDAGGMVIGRDMKGCVATNNHDGEDFFYPATFTLDDNVLSASTPGQEDASLVVKVIGDMLVVIMQGDLDDGVFEPHLFTRAKTFGSCDELKAELASIR